VRAPRWRLPHEVDAMTGGTRFERLVIAEMARRERRTA
jgi:hypothetical protein